MARISVNGVRRSKVRATQKEARQAERDLAAECREEAEQTQGVQAAPATIRLRCEYYVLDLERRWKDTERAATTAKAIEATAPTLLAKAVGKVKSEDLFDFRPGFAWRKGLFLPEDETRVRWLTPDVEAVLWDGIPTPRVRAICKLAALTLMRLSEIRLLRRDQVHLDQSVALLPTAKSGSRAVALSGDAQKVLKTEMEQHESEWVFPSPSGEPYRRRHVSTEFRVAARAAGLRDFHFHDLRHHGATVAINNGVSTAIVMSLGGWKSERMMRRYAAVTNKTLRAAAEVVSGRGPWVSGNTQWQ